MLGPGGKPKLNAGKLKAGPALKAANLQLGKINNKTFPILKGPKFIWVGGKMKKFLPYTALGAILIGASYYYPDAYVSLARPYCSGVTGDGCSLSWQMVEFEDGGSEPQCVQYCPRAGPPPANVMQVTAPPPAPANGRCELSIFAEPGFAGISSPASEDVPSLTDSGWRNQIASLQINAGTWDFFTDEEFAGNAMRLTPGPYPQLAPEWTKSIGSFMCVQPGN